MTLETFPKINCRTRANACFYCLSSQGIKDLWGPVSRCSLISLGCSLVRIPKSKLYEMIDMETLKKLRFCALTEQIPPDKELSECFTSSTLSFIPKRCTCKRRNSHLRYRCHAIEQRFFNFGSIPTKPKQLHLNQCNLNQCTTLRRVAFANTITLETCR